MPMGGILCRRLLYLPSTVNESMNQRRVRWLLSDVLQIGVLRIIWSLQCLVAAKSKCGEEGMQYAARVLQGQNTWNWTDELAVGDLNVTGWKEEEGNDGRRQ